MSERNGFPQGVPCWIDLESADTRAAASFYAAVFGWETEERMPPGSEGSYVYFRLRGRPVAAVASPLPEGSSPTPQWNTYIWVRSADETARAVREAGGRVVVEPCDVFAAGRLALCADPTGAPFRLWQANRLRGAELVNEPGTWSWSDLRTPDPSRARGFYTKVFGWSAQTMDVGAGEYTFFRHPGYDSVESPKEFIDVVAGMRESNGDGAHWHTQFAVADADAIAARVASHGGTVVSPPTDGPFSRSAVLRDPQGAAFTVNRLKKPPAT